MAYCQFLLLEGAYSRGPIQVGGQFEDLGLLQKYFFICCIKSANALNCCKSCFTFVIAYALL